MDVILGALAFQVLAGIVALAFSKWPRAATIAGAGGALLGCLVAILPTIRVLTTGTSERLDLPWDEAHGAFRCEIDPLSAFFLLPVLGLSALAAVYGSDYLLAYRRHKSLGSPWFFFNVFVAAMAFVVLARTTLLFLIAWEVMSVTAFFLVTFEHEKADVRQAGWIYLIAAHLGAVFLFLAFVLLSRNAGSVEFESFRGMSSLAATESSIIFVLALVGFGAKAGFIPFHVWLPETYPAAPSHVPALMSGVMSKMGIYGILRVSTYLGQPAAWWGLILAGIGLLTSLIGIALALQQRDVKRVLAYSSIENVGLIGLGLGTWLWASASGRPTIAALAITAALLHIWNHALMKGLMFFAAGSVLHGTGTQDMENLGGLMQRMPWTASAMVVGSVAIAALPPMNGFVSKWLLYLSLMKSGFETSGIYGLTPLFAVGFLALVGGLAATTFVRLTGIALLGSPRSELAHHAHESSPWMLGPMLTLIAFNIIVAVIPQRTVAFMGTAVRQLNGEDLEMVSLTMATPHAPLTTLGSLNGWILAASAAVAVIFLAWGKITRRVEGPTWGCGYAKPTVRMQYTGLSFVEMIAQHLLPRFLRPHSTKRPPRGFFPSECDFKSECLDPLSTKLYDPLFDILGNWFSRLRILQQGKVHVYLTYIVLMVVLTLAWVSIRTWWL
jgi:hydrogenase-4 component B